MTRAARWSQDVLSYDFSDPELLHKALTHRSLGGINNERLEFLGDAILNFVIAEALYLKLPSAREGDLSRLRASLVKGTTLAEIARGIGVGDRLRLGSGELKSGGYRRESILGDALEAIVGAIYLDGGMAAASRAIQDLFASRLENPPDPQHLRDPKTRLQEHLQAQAIALPVYSVESTSGEAHEQMFEVSCRIDALDITEVGSGSSRRRAEQQAAERALKHVEDYDSEEASGDVSKEHD